MATSYRVKVYSTNTDASTFAPLAVVMEFENPKQLGYASYLNDIGEAFFTISQYDPKVELRSQVGKAHVVIQREADGAEDVVWRGILAEIDATGDDVIFYAYGYEHFLYTLYTKWNQEWKNKEIAGATGRPINDLWTRAKTNLLDSPLTFATTGTLESPWTTNAQNINIVLEFYRVNLKRIITVFRELTALAVSDTDNMVFMELAYPKTIPTAASNLTLTFNYWRDNTSNITDKELRYPGNIMDFSDRHVPVTLRNKLYSVGSGPRGQLYRFNVTAKSGTYGRNLFGLRHEALHLSWVRDRKELKRIARRRLKVGQRGTVELYVKLYPDTIPPWHTTASTHHLGDRLIVDIDKGITSIDSTMDFMGEQVIWVGGREYVQPILEAGETYSESED